MTLTPFLETSPVIQLHVICALVALALGPVALWRKRRDRIHKIVGYVWVVSMALAAAVALFISSHFTPIGLGPIHLLSLYALFGIYQSMAAIYNRDIVTHKKVMEALYVRGLALAGAFNFLPGRTTQRALIPDHEWLGFVIIACVVVWAFAPLILSKLRANRPDPKMSLETAQPLR